MELLKHKVLLRYSRGSIVDRIKLLYGPHCSESIFMEVVSMSLRSAQQCMAMRLLLRKKWTQLLQHIAALTGINTSKQTTHVMCISVE